MAGKAPLRVAMIGYGAIGQEVARLAADDADMQIVAALVRDPTKARMIARPQLVTTLDALLAAMPEVVVEARRARSAHHARPRCLAGRV